MANPEHVELVRKGAQAIAEWLATPPRILEQFDLSGADLSRLDLSEADLTEADLSGANLSGSNLLWAILNRAELSNADFSCALCGATSLTTVDLSQVIGLGTVKHQFPSGVGIDTLITSVRNAGDRLPQVVAFLRGAGVPQELLDVLPAAVKEIKHYSCFISYGQPDLQFARRLTDDLRAENIRCWLWQTDKKVGSRIWSEIEQKLEEYERMVVLCSIDALIRRNFKKEVDKQIDRNPEKLVPVSLDDRWTQDGFEAAWNDRDLKTWLLDRNYADFVGWESDPEQYDKGLQALLRGLER